jgi:hypothetical protein
LLAGTKRARGWTKGGLTVFDLGSKEHNVLAWPAFRLYYWLWPGRWHMIATTGKRDVRVFFRMDGVRERVEQLMGSFRASNAMRSMPTDAATITQVSCESFIAWVVYCAPAILIRALDDCGHVEAAYMWRWAVSSLCLVGYTH